MAEETVAIDTEDSCRCGLNIPLIEQKLSNTIRKMFIMMCATCIIALAACGCCIYLYTEIEQIRQELSSIHKGSTDDGKEADGNHYYEYVSGEDYDWMYEGDANKTRVTLQSDPLDREKRKDAETADKKVPRDNERKSSNGRSRSSNAKSRHSRCCKCCKRLDKKLNSLKKQVKKLKKDVLTLTLTTRLPPTTQTTTKPRPTTQQPTTISHRALQQKHSYIQKTSWKKKTLLVTSNVFFFRDVFKKHSDHSNHIVKHVAAAHYTSYVSNEFISNFFEQADHGNLHLEESCKEKRDWHGVLCRNRTFLTSAPRQKLNVFKEADWMRNVSQQQVFDMRNGVFIARHTGLYLIYAHVLFYDSQKTQAIELVHDRQGREQNTFRCIETRETVTLQPGFVQETGYLSCSVNAVVFMKKADAIQVNSLYPDSGIDLTPDTTYFGGLVFITLDDELFL